MSGELQPPWSQVRAAFDRALDLNAAERQIFLAANFEDDVVDQVRSLLAHHEAATEFLAPAPPGLVCEGPDSEETPSASLEGLEGRVLAGRYTVGALIARGGSASVHEAHDRISKETVAIKIRPAAAVSGFDLLRSEGTALRLLRLPGVVDLLDDGIEEGLSFLVMARIHGKPFPGAPVSGSRTWKSVRRATLSLLETLARVHWAGLVHCDIKPGNVLVQEDGTCIVLDLGIAQDPGHDEATRHALAMARTPRYTSPEQLLGEPGTERSDLFAVGVMLYEALAGGDPHGVRDAAELLCFRPHVPPPPLSKVVPGVPVHVASLVDQLMSPSPAARPPSAADALARLRAAEADDAELPLTLGPRDATDRIVRAAEQGEAIDLSGTTGSGRTSTLRAAARRLENGGREVLWTSAGKRPYASLASLLKPPFEVQAKTAEEARAQVLDALQDLLRGGVVIMADDMEGLDRSSFAALDACRGHGAIVRMFGETRRGALPLPRLTESDLAALFLGHERIHHVPSDAAAELGKRAAGRPGAVQAELAAWERAGLARWEGPHMVIRRSALERLRSGLRVRSAEPEATDVGNEDRADLRACIDLLGPPASVDRCSRVLGLPSWQVASHVTELVEAGDLTRDPEGALRCVRPTLGGAHWSAERRRSLHGRIADALPSHEPARLYHRLRSGDATLIGEETLAIAQSLLSRGSASQACSVLADGIWALRRQPEAATEDRQLELLLRASLQLGTIAALDNLLYVLDRAGTPTAHLELLQGVARSARLGMQRDTERALALLPSVEATIPEEALRSLVSTKMFLARQLDPERAEALIEETAAFVNAQCAPQVAGPILTARAWIAYAREAFVEAAELHAEVAEGADTPLNRLASLLNSASAWLEAGQHGRAHAMAVLARDQAYDRRHMHYEARAERLLRAAAYRNGTATNPDTELTSAMEAVGVPQLEALTNLNEAAVAWRAGRRLLAGQLARRAEKIWRKAGNRWPRILACALNVATGGEISDEALRAFHDQLEACPSPTLVVQAAHLLALVPSQHRALFRRQVLVHAERVPKDRWAACLEIVSVSEAVQ